MDPDGLGSSASRSDSLISLSYSMAVFSMKSFGLLIFKIPNIYGVIFFSNQLSARAALVYCSSVKFNAPVGAIDHRYEEEPVLNGVECDEDFLLAPLKDEPTDYGGAHHHYS